MCRFTLGAQKEKLAQEFEAILAQETIVHLLGGLRATKLDINQLTNKKVLEKICCLDQTFIAHIKKQNNESEKWRFALLRKPIHYAKLFWKFTLQW